jgi:hypothetical protein
MAAFELTEPALRMPMPLADALTDDQSLMPELKGQEQNTNMNNGRGENSGRGEMSPAN